MVETGVNSIGRTALPPTTRHQCGTGAPPAKISHRRRNGKRGSQASSEYNKAVVVGEFGCKLLVFAHLIEHLSLLVAVLDTAKLSFSDKLEPSNLSE